MFINLKLSIWCFIKFKYRFAEQFWIWPWGSLNTVPNCVAWPSLGQNLPPLSSELQREGSHVQTLSNNTKLWLFVRTIQCVPVTPVPMSSLAPSSLEHYLFMWTVSPLQITDNPPSHSPPCTRSSDSLLCSWHFGHFLAYSSLLIRCLQSWMGMRYIYPRQVNDQRDWKIQRIQRPCPLLSVKTSITALLSPHRCSALSKTPTSWCSLQGVTVSIPPPRQRAAFWIVGPLLPRCLTLCMFLVWFVAFVVRSLEKNDFFDAGITKAQLFLTFHDAVLFALSRKLPESSELSVDESETVIQETFSETDKVGWCEAMGIGGR